jgi:hypothetical protein
MAARLSSAHFDAPIAGLLSYFAGSDRMDNGHRSQERAVTLKATHVRKLDSAKAYCEHADERLCWHTDCDWEGGVLKRNSTGTKRNTPTARLSSESGGTQVKQWPTSIADWFRRFFIGRIWKCQLQGLF